MDDRVVHYGEEMLALISVHLIVPPFSDVYGLSDMSGCPFGQYLGIIPIIYCDYFGLHGL